jgi:hypothetical protein
MAASGHEEPFQARTLECPSWVGLSRSAEVGGCRRRVQAAIERLELGPARLPSFDRWSPSIPFKTLRPRVPLDLDQCGRAQTP